MAVLDIYTDAQVAAGKLGNPAMIQGAQAHNVILTFEVAAADSDLSVYRVLKNLDPNLIPFRFIVANDAITAGTSYSLGLYLTGIGGAAISTNVFATAVDMSSARATQGAGYDALTNVNIDSLYKRLYEHAGHTILTRKTGYDLAWTATTVGSAAGTITMWCQFIQG